MTPLSNSMPIDTPLITVVVPAYNRATTITGCVRSVQAQTYAKWELLVVDDGSSDGTPQVVAKSAQNDNRPRLLRQARNGGAQAARNAGIRAAMGTWVAFLDSDDKGIIQVA